MARSCHGNVWKNWCAPLLSSIDRQDPIDKHTRDILNSMTAQIRSEVMYSSKRKSKETDGDDEDEEIILFQGRRKPLR